LIKRFRVKPDDPQRTLIGLVVGALVMILIFLNIFFRHDYYTRRRGVLSALVNARNDFIEKTLREHTRATRICSRSDLGAGPTCRSNFGCRSTNTT
jgi:hypothetical protein